MASQNSDRQKHIPSHLGGAPRDIWGWIKTLGLWLLANILYGFAIIVAIIALWFQTNTPFSMEIANAIMKSVSLSLLAWATALMLSSADIPRLFMYFPSIGGVKGVLLVVTLLVFCISVLFIFQDPPDWSVYIDNPEVNQKLLLGSKWISLACIILSASWFVVHTLSMDREMRLRDSGYHDDYSQRLEELAVRARTEETAGGLRLK